MPYAFSEMPPLDPTASVCPALGAKLSDVSGLYFGNTVNGLDISTNRHWGSDNKPSEKYTKKEPKHHLHFPPRIGSAQ